MERQRVKLTFSYDGSKFNGFQRQKEQRSVQKTIEEALAKIYGKEILIKGAGRTDAGVHACGQVAHFDIDKYTPELKDKLNHLLSPDIYIFRLEKVNNDFHARKDAALKEYIYKINMGIYKAAFVDYYYQPNDKLDIKLMKNAAKEFIGYHDFRNFVSGYRDDYNSFVKSIRFVKFGNILEVHFKGVGFYRYMVRNMMGALLEVGTCKIYSQTIKDMLDHPETSKKLMTAPAMGLYLNKIWY